MGLLRLTALGPRPTGPFREGEKHFRTPCLGGPAVVMAQIRIKTGSKHDSAILGNVVFYKKYVALRCWF